MFKYLFSCVREGQANGGNAGFSADAQGRHGCERVQKMRWRQVYIIYDRDNGE